MKHLFLSIYFSLISITIFSQQMIPAGTIAIPSEYEVKNLEALNTGELDYSAVPFRNGVVFTSTRERSTLFGCSSDFTNGHYSDLYYSEKDAEGNFRTPQFLEGDVNAKYHDGTATFTSNETKMIFSRNNRKGTNAWGTIDLKVYESNLKNGTWGEAVELPFNSDDFATCHPTITPNGKWLYFASDRPGGFGGMDIYVIERKGNGSWGTPINLGSKVNSGGHELFPFISPEGILYWSSDGLGGMGGLDVFSIPISTGEDAIRYHLSAPINSSFDDFAFTTNFQGTEGYLTSDREGGHGKDDLYSWRFLGAKPKMANICVVDQKTGERISDAFLQINPMPQTNSSRGNIINKDGVNYLQMEATNVGGKEYLVLVPYDDKKEESPITGEGLKKSCGLKHPIIPGRLYEIIIDKQGYIPLRKTVRAEEILSKEEYLIPIKNTPPIAMRGAVKDKKNNEPIPLADVKVVNSCTNEKKEIITNRRGEFTFPMDCNCDYEITASKGDYQQDYEVVYSYDIKCEKDQTSILLYLEKDEFNPNPEPKFEVGAVIRLDKLYYDYDKFFIRSDAAVELDKVVSYMRKYPSLEIELGSHTDARGSDEYNRRLSQNRAQAAVDYIISRGISSRRITAAGYGESQLVNQCANGVECSDYYHQQNRRTEIKVTRFSEKGVRVED